MPRKSQNSLIQANNSLVLKHRSISDMNHYAYDEPNVCLRHQWPARHITVQRNHMESFFDSPKNDLLANKKSEDPVDYVTANCQILILPTEEDAPFFENPDIKFPWDRVLGVRCYQAEVPKCPICIEPPVAPRMGKCGHIYCLPCIKHCLRQKEDNHKCAVCFKPLEVDDLRRVSIVPLNAPKVGDNVKLILMRRAKRSIFPKVAQEKLWDQEAEKQCKFMSQFAVLDRKELLSQIELEIKALEDYAKEYESYGSSEWALSSKTCIRKLKCEEKKLLRNAEPDVSLNLFGEIDTNDCYLYYQDADGSDVYLHSINWKCLLEDYGISELPAEISGKVIEVDTFTMNSDLRHRFRHLKHLPIGRTFFIVEIEMENPVITETTLVKFSDLLARRLEKRLRREELELELSIEKEIAENTYCLLPPESRLVGHVKLEGTSFTDDDFVPLEVVSWPNSAPLISSSTPRRSFASVSAAGASACVDKYRVANFSKLNPPKNVNSSPSSCWFDIVVTSPKADLEFPPLQASNNTPQSAMAPPSSQKKSRRNKHRDKCAKDSFEGQ